MAIGWRQVFNVFGIGADIADMREGEGYDLTGVGRVGQDFFVTGQCRVEHDFGFDSADCAGPLPSITVPSASTRMAVRFSTVQGAVFGVVSVMVCTPVWLAARQRVLILRYQLVRRADGIKSTPNCLFSCMPLSQNRFPFWAACFMRHVSMFQPATLPLQANGLKDGASRVIYAPKGSGDLKPPAASTCRCPAKP